MKTIKRSWIKLFCYSLGFDPEDVRSIHLNSKEITVERYPKGVRRYDPFTNDVEMLTPAVLQIM